MKTHLIYYTSPIGLLEIEGTQKHIVRVEFVMDEGEAAKRPPLLLKKCAKELSEYFAGERREFTVPIQPEGTAFQQKVWKEVLKLPYGHTTTYMDIARQLKDTGAVRAVGGANGKNKIAIILPCHRVIAEDGKLSGYAWHLWRKQWLLEHEGKVAGTRLSLF